MRKIFTTIPSRKSTFRLQYASNLFVDLQKRPFPALVEPVPNTSTLALLGNIGHPHDVRTYRFLDYCASRWKTILWILGPHEISNKSGETKLFYELADSCLNLANHFPDRVKVMNHNELYLPKEHVALVGASLWTEEPTYLPEQPEFSTILTRRELPVSLNAYKEWNKEDCDFLYIKGRFWQGYESKAPLIFLTHHLPVPYLLNVGLSKETYARASLDVNKYQEELRPGISVWLAGATGSCSSGFMGRNVESQTFCAVNSCFEYPYKDDSQPNPGYYNKMLVEVETHETETRPDTSFPPVKGLPPLVSPLFKPKVSMA